MESLIPTQKEKNLFWSSALISVPISIFGGLFAGFMSNQDIFPSPLIRLSIFLIIGLLIIDSMLIMKNKIIPIPKGKLLKFRNL